MNKKGYSILKKTLSALLAVMIAATAFPAHAMTKIEASTGKIERIDDTELRREDDFDHWDMVPRDENGKPVLERKVKNGPKDDYSTIRVLLKLEKKTTFTLSAVGAFYIDQNNAPVVGTEEAPAVVTFKKSGSNVVAEYNGANIYTGKTIDFNRVNIAEAGGYCTLTSASNDFCNGRSFLGSFRVKINSDGYIQVVNIVPTAHYLHAIVPYEMNEGCDLEALKTQAIAAKTYAFGYTNATADYDVINTDGQDYRGYKSGNPKCMQAIQSVRGEILMYKGSVPLAFYSSANGGETANPGQIYGYPSDLDNAYYFKLDDVDFNYAPKLKTLDIIYGGEISNEAFKKLLEKEASKKLGYQVGVNYITKAKMKTPKYAGSVRNLTVLEVTLNASASDGKAVSVTMDISTDLIKSSGIFNVSYKMFWGQTITNGYRINYCRSGHGIGLSQYGAIALIKSGYTYKQALKYYFNMDLVSIKEKNPETPNNYSKKIIAYGSINSTTVRMRSEPNTSSTILDKLSLNTHVNIVGEKDDWFICIANGKLGYIRGDLVTISVFPSADGASQSIGSAKVLSNTEAVFRKGPSVHCATIKAAPAGESVEIWHTIGSWYHVMYEGRSMYIHSSFLSIPTWSNRDMHSRT